MAVFNVHMAITPNVGNLEFMVDVFNTSSYGALHLCEVS